MSSIKSSFKWSFIIQASFQIIGFLVSIILARILSPSDFGIIGILTIFINLSKNITDGGLASSLIRTKDPSEVDFSTVFYFNLVCSVFMYAILFITAPFVAVFFKLPLIENLLRVFGVTIILSAFTITQSVKLNKELNFKTQFKILLPSLLISAIAGISSAYYGMGVWSLVIKEVVFSLLASMQLWFYSRWKPLRVFNRNSFKNHFYYGYKLVITDVISQFFNDSNKAIIGKIFSPAQLGFFTRAQTMQDLPNQVIFNTINRVLFPMLSKVQDSDIRLRDLYRQVIKIISFLVTPFLTLLYLVAKPLFIFLLTEKWLPAVPYFKILIIAGMIAPLQPYLLNICKVKGRSDMVLKLSLVEYFFIFLSMLAIIPFGIYGLLWGLVVATIGKLMVAMYFSGKLIHYSIKSQLLDLKEGFVLSLIGFLWISGLQKGHVLPDNSPLLSLIVTSTLYYILLILIAIFFKFEGVSNIKLLFKKNERN